jgi:hypothetical protein
MLLIVERLELELMPNRAAAEALEQSILRTVQHLVRLVAARRAALVDTIPKDDLPQTIPKDETHG